MSEQDEFEKWLDDFKLKQEQRGFHNVYPSRSEVWKACAEGKDKIIEQQAADLAALREFANEVIDYNNLYLSNKNGFVDRYSKCYSLIDENGNPTSLLTGVKDGN
jgi:hypothetical protein